MQRDTVVGKNNSENAHTYIRNTNPIHKPTKAWWLGRRDGGPHEMAKG